MKKEPTFVYLCRNGDNEELRYSLRSVDHFYPEASVWLVGGKPDWYTGNYIYVSQERRDKFEAVLENLYHVAFEDDIDEKIIMMNDDFFFVKKVSRFKPLISGTIRESILSYVNSGTASAYVSHLKRLMASLKPIRKLPLDFELHVPMPIKKSNLQKMVKEGITTMWRSNYGNRFYSISETTTMPDVKVYPNNTNSFKNYDYMSFKYPFFSTQDDSFSEVRDRLLNDMFPSPSKYESGCNDV